MKLAKQVSVMTIFSLQMISLATEVLLILIIMPK